MQLEKLELSPTHSHILPSSIKVCSLTFLVYHIMHSPNLLLWEKALEKAEKGEEEAEARSEAESEPRPCSIKMQFIHVQMIASIQILVGGVSSSFNM